ncbi:type II toxin-antitoxin system HicB family antitoxin [Celeribacter halophilus]|uniref:type II toxin-antitoxin system HicB family antitoxin n=1 Tax=Celeribacter halophilus TaxID=576117 RepID=UPI0026E30A21|nr:type II toxin-antitoxin system HicB family antitoxin [Celeribacter halophilus]MDO6722649.1 type II toxin-antitoxin system HicB family antitoxin [Celeribacter halophilus]
MYYWAIVHHDEGSAYGVTFPDLEGCFAAADDQEKVMSAAIEALDLYFEDATEAPAAKSLNTVHEIYKEDLAEGAYLIQVPLIPRTTKSVRVNLSFDQGLLSAIDNAADRVGLNRSAFLAMAAKQTIQNTEAA